MARITIADIALEAGVSPQTVSRVINNRPDVAEDTRQRVQAIIQRLDYKPNAIARGLRAKRTWMIGVIIESPRNFGPRSKFVELDKQAHLAGYRMLPFLIHEQDTREIAVHLDNLLPHQPDGIIWAPTEIEGDASRFEETVIDVSIPMVTMEASIYGVPKPAAIDQFETSRLLVTHLIEKGYRNIGIISGPLQELQALSRVRGWQAALRDAGLPAVNLQTAEGDWSAESGRHGMIALLDTFSEIDALFAANDEMALGAMSLAQERGMNIPQDLGLVAFDDIPEASHFRPPLTTARQPFREYCEFTVKVLAEMIQAKFSGSVYTPPETVTLYSEIIFRESSGAKGRDNSM